MPLPALLDHVPADAPQPSGRVNYIAGIPYDPDLIRAWEDALDDRQMAFLEWKSTPSALRDADEPTSEREYARVHGHDRRTLRSWRMLPAFDNLWTFYHAVLLAQSTREADGAMVKSAMLVGPRGTGDRTLFAKLQGRIVNRNHNVAQSTTFVKQETTVRVEKGTAESMSSGDLHDEINALLDDPAVRGAIAERQKLTAMQEKADGGGEVEDAVFVESPRP